MFCFVPGEAKKCSIGTNSTVVKRSEQTGGVSTLSRTVKEIVSVQRKLDFLITPLDKPQNTREALVFHSYFALFSVVRVDRERCKVLLVLFSCVYYLSQCLCRLLGSDGLMNSPINSNLPSWMDDPKDMATVDPCQFHDSSVVRRHDTAS